jgi:hypothetical protein
MGRKRRPHLGSLPDQEQRSQAAYLRDQGLSFAAIGRRLGISKQAAWHLIVKGSPGHVAGVRCSACQAVVTTRHFQSRTVGEVLCRQCLAAQPHAPFALRLRSHRLAAGMSRPELQHAAALVAGRVKDFEERGAKPHAATRGRLANVLGCRTWSGSAVRTGEAPAGW